MQEPGFSDYIGESVLVIGHNNADPDAVGAAQGVKELVEQIKPNTKINIVMPNDISKLSTQLINNLELEVHEEYTSFFDTIILVDSGGLNQIGEWEAVILAHRQVIVLIDHHTVNSDLFKCVDLLIHDDEAGSTCQIIHNLFKKYGIKPSQKTAKAMVAGIAFDSKFFSIGSSDSFQAVSELLSEMDISEVLSLFHTELDVSERIARIKTAQRAETHRINGYLVVFSEVGSYQASGARALISLGADLAIVAGEMKDELRASLRSTQRFYETSGLHLGELVSQYTSNYGGSGSGHPTAAGYNGITSYTDFKTNVLRLIS